MTTIADALRDAAGQLAAISDTARLDAELLMAHALGASRSDLLLRHMRDAVPAGFEALLERRLGHEPVAYIIGRQEFFGRDFAVTSDVLIPRGDSETLILAALEVRSRPGRVLDCGTGSGALLLTVLAECERATGIGIDRSQAALAVASRNAGALGLSARAQMRHVDWTQRGWSEGLGRFDLILANPPYVEEDAQLAPSVRLHEPAGALFAGPQGLDDYRVLLPQLRGLLAEGGVAVIEIGWTQAETVSLIASEAGFSVQLRHDLGGRPRALVLEIGLGNAHNRE
jgi:release factor glutamine methyltransferase